MNAGWSQCFPHLERAGKIGAEGIQADAATRIGKVGQDFHASFAYFDSSVEVAAPHVQVDDRGLQDAAIQIADRKCFCAPGEFEGFVRFKVASLVEEAESLLGVMGEGFVAIVHARSITFGPSEI